jgi:hypothetical protein
MRIRLIFDENASFSAYPRLLLGLRPVALAIDGAKVARIVGPTVRNRQNVVDLVRFAQPAEPDALVTPAKVLITLEDLVAQPAPRPTAPARACAGSPGLGLLGRNIGMSIAVAVGIAMDRPTALSAARSLGSQWHGYLRYQVNWKRRASSGTSASGHRKQSMYLRSGLVRLTRSVCTRYADPAAVVM